MRRARDEDFGDAVLKVGSRGRDVGVDVGGVSIKAPGIVFGKSSLDTFLLSIRSISLISTTLTVDAGGFMLAVDKDMDVA